MKRLISWFVDNTVAANLLMILVLAGGAFSLLQLRPTIIPDIKTGLVNVSVVYPGATPAEVEESVCVKLEEEIWSVDGIKRLTSTAFEGMGVVTAELYQDTDVQAALTDIKNRVDAIDTFPDDTERPVVQETAFHFEVVTLAIAGPLDEGSLKRLGEHIRDDLTALPGITRVELKGTRTYEVAIEVSEYALRKHGLSFDAVANAIRRASLDVPGGAVKAEGGQILLRTLGQSRHGTEFAAIPVLTRSDGSRLTVGDVATVRDGFEETESVTRFDGRPAAIVQVFRVGSQGSLEIMAAVRDYLERTKGALPQGATVTTWRDNTKYLEGRLDLLIRNGRVGLLLVFICLALFLRLGMALWVSVGIPVSFMGALWLMPGLDVSINMISLFGFIIVLGIVVDDAIVIGENVYTHFQRGKDAVQAAKDGANEVAIPVVFAVLTTIAAFSPMLGLPGRNGQFARNIPLVVIACLAFSLVEAMLVLPAHLRHLRPDKAKRRGLGKAWGGFQGVFTKGLAWFIGRVYEPVLAWCLRWRYLTVAVACGVLMLCIGFVRAGWLKLTFFPPLEADNVSVALTMPRGTPIEVTSAAIEKLERTAQQLRSEIDRASMSDGESIFRHVLASVGRQPFREFQKQQIGDLSVTQTSSHLGEVTIELAPSEIRTMSSTEVERRWREIAGSVPDAVELTFTSSLTSADAINIQLTAPSLETLRTAARRLEEKLATYVGVIDITDTLRTGKEEIQIRMKSSGEALGVRASDVGRQVRQAFFGEEVQRIQRGRDDVPVMLRYTQAERESLAAIDDMRIRTAAGSEVPLATCGTLDFGRGYAEIRRSDRRRSVSVLASVDARANANEVKTSLEQTILPQLVAENPGLAWSHEGTGREQAEMIAGMIKALGIALVVIYGLLAVPFKSYIQPMIIMAVIPFGIVGAIFGHMLLGMDLSMMSFIGAIALTGIVVNDSLVMVDFVNRARRAGRPVREAVLDSGVSRFRPILLTSLTTCAGLTPMLLERSLQAQFLIPTAVSLAFGVMFATGITLVLVPCAYWILEDLRAVFGRLYGR